MAEVRPFLQSVLEGVHIPQSRLDEVIHHYEAFKGISPYNKITRKKKEALTVWLKEKGLATPVYIGLRHASPGFKETFEAMKRDGIEKVIGFVLSSFRCSASFEKYIKKLEEGRAKADASRISVEYTDNFFNHPLFLEAQASQITSKLKGLSREEQEKTYFIFSAHSIPISMSEDSGYADQFLKASSLIAEQLKFSHWVLGYQSRSGNPRDPWLSPDVKEIIQKLDPKKFHQVMLIPIGFLCDNMEVLYDLDTEAKAAAETMDIRYLRASTVMDHPQFIEMMGIQISQKLEPRSVCR